MTHFNFDTNIEKRMPDTGKVFFVDRMTSDYAKAHPFDVDEFIEQVYQKYELMAQEDAHACAMGWNKSREELRRMWTAVLSDMNPRGDSSLYPNQNGPQPALMEVWHKAGDYWRMGFRQGDLLPAIVPATKITRLDDGEWIALFPKDMGLLDCMECHEIVAAEKTTTNFTNDTNIQEHEPAEQNDAPEYSEPAKSESAPEQPKQLDLFAQMQMEITEQREQNDACISSAESRRDSTKGQMQALRKENERLRCNMTQTEQAAVCSPEPAPSPKPRRAVRAQKPAPSPYERLYGAPAIAVDHTNDYSDRNRKIFAAVATAVVFIVLVNTIGLFGIAALGLIVGGVVK